MDGTQTLAEIRRKGVTDQSDKKPVPVVLLTADDTAGAREHYLEIGFDDYLAKPIEPQQIRDQVDHFLHI